MNNRLEGYRLLQEGLCELAVVEANGIRIDVELLSRTQKELQAKSRALQKRLQEHPHWRKWQRRFGAQANLNAHQQLGDVLVKDLGFEFKAKTKSGRDQMNEEALMTVDDPFVKDLLRLYKYDKAGGTFLRGIASEVAPDGRLHPHFNLHTVRTYRSSSNAPNFQNFPVRDKEIGRLIRQHFVASTHHKHVLVENDFKGIEVALSASYHKDPVFIEYITTPGKDMHRDMAAQLYIIEPGEVAKEVRHSAKNKFVFPQFYGDFYPSCAKALWEEALKRGHKNGAGLDLIQHLRSQGIKSLGLCDPDEDPRPHTFEAHVRDVEKDFWNRRFQKYGQWRRDWFSAYLRNGYFDLLTGFRVYGFFKRNAVINYPVQGSAFHCLLWSLIQVNRILRKERMRSKIVGQIHDSMIGDVRIDELRDYLAIVEDVTANQLPKHWPWLVVSPEIEYEMSLPGKSWHDKQSFRFKNGYFLHPSKEARTADAHIFLNTLQKESAHHE